MDELTIGDKIYISSKQAAKITGYAKDYVGQLCREGRVDARLVGRNWYVLESSIREHRFGAAPEGVEATPEPVEEPKTAPTSAWEPATYAPVQEESPLPPLEAPQSPIEKPDATEAVALMQDAWKEWFAARAEAEAAAREGAQVAEEKEIEPLESPEESSTEEVRVSDIPNEYNVSGVSQELEDEDEVVLSRVSEEVSEEEYVQRPQVSPHVLDVSHSRPIAHESVVDLSRASVPEYEAIEEPVYVPRRKRRRAARTRFSVQAIFIAIAGLAVVIAVIGSGVVDHLLIENGMQDGFRGQIFESIRGETRINKQVN